MIYETFYNENTKTWNGLETGQLFDPNMSIGFLILKVLNLNPDKIGQISDNNGIQFTNREIRTKTIDVAINLQKFDIKKGDVIGIISTNHHNLAPIIFAAMAIAAPVNCLDPFYEPDELAHMIGTTEPKLIICNDHNLNNVQKALDKVKMNVPIVILTENGTSTICGKIKDNLFTELLEERKHFTTADIGDGTKHPAIIICSSGTTGPLKGVPISHATVVEQMRGCYGASTDDIVFCFSTLYWLTGFVSLIGTTLSGMTRIITTNSFSAELMLNILEKYKVTVVFSTPIYIISLLESEFLKKTDLSNIKLFFCGGSYVANELCKRMNKYLKNEIYVGYGITEYGGMLTSNYPKPKLGSVGKLANGLKVQIINDNEQLCDINEHGEIIAKFKFPFLGYYNNEKNNEILNESGWFLTGDIGYFNKDGYLFIVDRKKEIFKCMRQHISPSEIENVILEHPGVLGVCVVDIPDMRIQSLPAAVVIKDNNFNLNEEDIVNLVKSKLAVYKQIRGGVYFVSNFPTTSSGKIIRRKVKEIAINLFNQRVC